MVDPEGYPIGIFSGEGHRETLDRYVSAALELYGNEGTLDRKTGEAGMLELTGEAAHAQRVYAPGKLTAPFPGTEIKTLPKAILRDAGDITLEIVIDLPEETKLNNGSPVKCAFGFDGGALTSEAAHTLHTIDTPARKNSCSR